MHRELRKLCKPHGARARAGARAGAGAGAKAELKPESGPELRLSWNQGQERVVESEAGELRGMATDL